MSNQAASRNLVADEFTWTGEFYRQMTGAPSSTSTTPATTSPESTNSALSRTPGLATGLLIAVTVIVVAILVVLMNHRTKSVLR